MTQEPLHCDILIVGGGPVGSILAGLLAKLPLHIIVVDVLTPEDVLHKDQDGRTTAVSWGSSQIMEKIGLWQKLLPHATPIREVRVSQSSGPGFLHFNQEDADGRPMGFILENRKLREALYQMMDERDNIRLITPHSVNSLAFHPLNAKAILSNGQIIQAKLVAGADGRSSEVREKAGIKSHTIPYHQTAIVTSVQHEKPHHHIAFEHFLPTGPLAFLPLKTHHSSVVWSLKNECVKAMQPLSQEEFAQELENRFPYLGRLTLTSKRWSYPLAVTLPRQIKTERLVLIGDAAHAIHPVAGQGANLGFRDALTLSSLIHESFRLGIDIGNETLLSRYQRRRFQDIASMTCITDGLVRFFSRSSRSLAFLRGQGLSLANAIAPLRKRLTQHAMGIGL